MTAFFLNPLVEMGIGFVVLVVVLSVDLARALRAVRAEEPYRRQERIWTLEDRCELSRSCAFFEEAK